MSDAPPAMPAGPAPRRLHPATLVIRWLKAAPQMIAGAIALAVGGMGGRNLGAYLTVLAILAAGAAVVAFVGWWRFTYLVDDDEVVIEKGLFERQRRVIPFHRIQDIAIEQRLLARLFGTATVRLETGGSASDEGRLETIGLDEAKALRDRIRRGAATVRVEGEAPEAAPVAEPLLFRMDPPRLLIAGMFNFSLIFLAAIGAVIQYLDQFNLIEWDEWITPERADEAAHLVTLQTTLVLVALIILAGLVAGIVQMVMTNFGFRLTRTGTGFRRRRGLFTLTEVVIPLKRTQVALIESGPFGRLFGWYALSFQTLGADRKAGGVEAAAPFARMGELLPILAEAGFPVPPPRGEFHGVPKRALVRQTAPWLALFLLTAVIAIRIEPWAAGAAFVLLAVAIFAVLRWRKHAYALGDEALFVSHGFLKRRLWILPFARTQTISVSRGPVQRGLSLASLTVDTAGAPLTRAQGIVDLDAGDAERLAGRLLGLFRRARAATRLQPG